MSDSELQLLLRGFNVRGYAGDVVYNDTPKSGKLLSLVEGVYTYEDEFYGGEPYSGNETIWKEGIPYFRVVYWGRVLEGFPPKEVYPVLKQALLLGPDAQSIHRGPTIMQSGEWEYSVVAHGTIRQFRLTETICIGKQMAYQAYFFGGLVNQ